MKTLHFDCFSGISGDMTLGALLDAGVPESLVRDGLISLGLPIEMNVEKIRKGGFAATQVWFRVPEEKTHRHLPDIQAILDHGNLTPPQRDLAWRIFTRLGQAEADAHGIALEKVHFHEVGALDSIADIVGVAIAIDWLGVQRISSRSVPTGQGTVKCEHGLMPIPTPATANLLRGVPLAASPIRSELTTPTGAAILATLVQDWTDSPEVTIEQIGHGAGMKDFLDVPNLLRIFVGTQRAVPATDRVCVLETNLDDVPGEIIGYTFERLLAAGALDVYTMPLTMKKQRPGVLLGVICPPALATTLETILFSETGTFGIRRYEASRTKLEREIRTKDTPWGPVRVKRGWRDGVEIITPEYEDCAQRARETGVPLREIYRVLLADS
jgi:uncharacterized protein (TIGR00299 family) protein